MNQSFATLFNKRESQQKFYQKSFLTKYKDIFQN
jgi:hypothetical protein